PDRQRPGACVHKSVGQRRMSFGHTYPLRCTAPMLRRPNPPRHLDECADGHGPPLLGGGTLHQDPSPARHRLIHADAPAVWRSAAVTVLTRSMATVIGPTPPGTGVIAPATGATASKSTSPTRR